MGKIFPFNRKRAEARLKAEARARQRVEERAILDGLVAEQIERERIRQQSKAKSTEPRRPKRKLVSLNHDERSIEEARRLLLHRKTNERKIKRLVIESQKLHPKDQTKAKAWFKEQLELEQNKALHGHIVNEWITKSMLEWLNDTNQDSISDPVGSVKSKSE